jgi:multisubunit Na+/H+ antiporter MnhF subunit
MAEQVNPAATHHLPMFITAPGQTDVLMVVMAVILALSVLGVGILFLRLHSLPERVAHKGQKIQFEIVAILGLLALFTHIHIFWVAALLLAFIDIPDFGGFLGRIAGSVERMAGLKPGAGADDSPDAGSVTSPHAAETASHQQTVVEPTGEKKPIRAVASRKELDHA